MPPKVGERSSRQLRHRGGCHPLSVVRRCATTALSPSPRPCVRRAPLRRWRPLTAGEPPRRLHRAAHGGGYAPPLPHCLLLRGRPRVAAFAASPVWLWRARACSCAGYAGSAPSGLRPPAPVGAGGCGARAAPCRKISGGGRASAAAPTGCVGSVRFFSRSLPSRPRAPSAATASRGSSAHGLLIKHPSTGLPRGAPYPARAQPPLSRAGGREQRQLGQPTPPLTSFFCRRSLLPGVGRPSWPSLLVYCTFTFLSLLCGRLRRSTSSFGGASLAHTELTVTLLAHLPPRAAYWLRPVMVVA